jgi:hypothetical protein
MPEDSDIVKHVLNGDVDSFRILVERYQRPVLSMIRRLIWDSHRCEEIGQDVFVTAFRKLSTFDPARSQFSTWLFTIARNMSINALKKKIPVPIGAFAGNPRFQKSVARVFGQRTFRCKWTNAQRRCPESCSAPSSSPNSNKCLTKKSPGSKAPARHHQITNQSGAVAASCRHEGHGRRQVMNHDEKYRVPGKSAPVH